MSAVLIFPLVFQTNKIMAMAEVASMFSDHTVQQWLTPKLRQQQQVLIRKGMTPAAAKREVKAFELAIRAEVWRLQQRCDGGAA